MEYITVADVIEFLCDHEYAGEDFSNFFGVDIWEDDIDDLNNRLEASKVFDWIMDHEVLARDLLMYLSDMSEAVVGSVTMETIAEILSERLGILP